MMKLFKGDTFTKSIVADDNFTFEDKINIKIYDKESETEYYNSDVTIKDSTNIIDLEVDPVITKTFPCKPLILQIKLTNKSGYVKTHQFKIFVKACK